MAVIWLRIEFDAVGYPDEYVAAGNSIVPGHAHPDAAASRVDHGLEMPRGFDPVVDGVLGGVGCAGEHREFIPEAAGAAGVSSDLAFLWGAMPGVPPVGAGLGGVHRGFIGRQLRHAVGLAGLINQSCRISRLSVRPVLLSLADISSAMGV